MEVIEHHQTRRGYDDTRSKKSRTKIRTKDENRKRDEEKQEDEGRVETGR